MSKIINKIKAFVKTHKKLSIIILILTTLFTCLIIGISSYFIYKAFKDDSSYLTSTQSSDSNVQQDNTGKELDYIISREPFADIDIEISSYTPQLASYNISDNYSEISNLSRFTFDEEIKEKLLTNYFTAIKSTGISTKGYKSHDYETINQAYADSKHNEFFPIYEENRYNAIPSFITTDSILHTYHLMFDDSLKSLEQSSFYSILEGISNSMLDDSKKQYDYYKSNGNDDFTTASKRNVAYFAVSAKLLNPELEIPSYVENEVTQELELITKHNEGFELSPIMTIGVESPTLENDYKEDYTQYIPRGHYTETDRLKKYFKAMMWYGRITFRQKSESENISALLITQTIDKNSDIATKWSKIYDATSFFVGSSDDLTIYEYSQVMSNAFDTTEYKDLTNSENLNKFLSEIKKLDPPTINSMPIFDESVNPDREEEIKGFRFMGQRYTLDAEIFQHLIYREVKENSNGERRNMPESLDILAAMGSDKAYDLLEEQGDTAYENYTDNMSNMKSYISKLEESTWTQNLYWGWLYTIKPATSPLGSGYPPFMINDAWIYKDMNTYQASWTELKHDTILYSKQAYAEYGDTANEPEIIQTDDRGYVEPRVDVYARLEALAKASYEGLEARDLLSSEFSYSYIDEDCPAGYPEEECTVEVSFEGERLKSNLQDLEETAKKLKNISIKELEDTSLTEEDYSFIKEYGGEIEHMWYSTFHTNVDYTEVLNENPLMLVSDVATDPDSGTVLEEATGRVQEIYVIIPLPGSGKKYYRVARGTIWSHYEFTEDATNRLTDEAWIERVKNGNLPDTASWKSNYLLEELTTTIKPRNLSYKNLIDEGYMTIDQARQECVNNGAEFNECGSACPESDTDCDRTCEPVCIYW